MTERERVFAVLAGQKPDRVPWFGDLDYWLPYAKDKGLLLPEYHGDGLFKLHRDLGVGFYLQGHFPFRTEHDGVTVTTRADGDRSRTDIETPVGRLYEESVRLPSSYTSAVTKHLIKTEEDLKVISWVTEHTRYLSDYAEAERRTELVGDNGAVLCYLPKSPFMELVALKAGIETVAALAADAPEVLRETLAVMEEKCDEAAEITLNSPAEFLMIPENISSEVVGKNFYERYMRGYHQKWTSRIRGAGKLSFVHLDGTMRGLISELSGAGFKVLEALTTAPVGDIAVAELEGWVNEDTVLWGGLPGMYFTDLITDGEFDRYVIETLEVMRQKPRFVLGVADQIPPGSRVERIKRVRELVDIYGRC